MYYFQALVDFSDFQIYQELIKSLEHNTFYKSCAAEMLRSVMEQRCVTRSQTLNYLGERFRVKLMLPEWYTNEQVAEHLLEYVFFSSPCHHDYAPANVVDVVVVVW